MPERRWRRRDGKFATAEGKLGGEFAAINKADMAALAVPWVDDGALEESLSEMDAAIANLEREVVDLTRARDELLPLLVSGRVRVEDVAV